jgi:hypothetical protein
MKKTILAAFLVLFAASAQAAEGGNWRDWYNNMIKGLRAKVEKRLESKTTVAAVAAVRGANQNSDPRALYWKGSVSESASKKLEGERKQLGDAMELAAGGDIAGGKAAIARFIKDNPDSVYLPDAKDALARLPAEEAAPAAAKPAAEQPAPKEAQPVQPKEQPKSSDNAGN